MEKGRIERTFTFAPGVIPKILARNPSGTIDVRGEAREDVTVVVTCDPLDAFERGVEIVIEQRDDTVLVETRWPGLLGGLRAFKARITMEIRAPRHSSVNADLASGEAQVAGIDNGVRVNTASGDARVSDVHGGVQINTASGAVRLGDAHGTVQLHTASGDVSIERGTGEFSFETASGDLRLDGVIGTLDLKTASGDVTATASAFPRARVKTVSGDASLATPLDPQGEYRFETVSGDLTLLVPDNTALTLTYSTLSGDIASSLPAQRDGGKRNGTLTVNGGGVPVRMNSVSGDCLIRAVRGTLPPLPAASSTPRETLAPATPAALALPEESETSETLRILQAVERGELSIDEAMEHLSRIEE